jgi:hypothetical protein
MVVHNVARPLEEAAHRRTAASSSTASGRAHLPRPGRGHRRPAQRRRSPTEWAGGPSAAAPSTPSSAGCSAPSTTSSTSSGATSSPSATRSTSTPTRSPWSTSTTSTTGPSGSWSASCCARRSRPRRLGAGRAAAVRRARRAQQVRAPRGQLAHQGAAARRGRAGPLARHHPHRRPADGQRGRAPGRGQLGHPGRGPARLGRGRPGRVRLAARRSSASGPPSSSRAR